MSKYCIGAILLLTSFFTNAQMVERLAAVGKVYNAIDRNFIYRDKMTADWDSVYKACIAEVMTANDDFDVMRALQRMVANCHDAHTTVHWPGWLNYLPFTSTKIDGKVYVDLIQNQQLIDNGMKKGQEIISINGLSPDDYATRNLLPYVASNTPQWTQAVMFENYGLSRGRCSAPFNMVLRDSSGQTVELNTLIGSLSRNTRLDSLRERFGFKILPENIGLLTLKEFGDSTCVEFFKEKWPEIMKTDGLIIDLRGNSGGNDDFAYQILSHLTDKPIATGYWETRCYKPAYASWGDPEQMIREKGSSFDERPISSPYSKPVMMLIDKLTISAGEDCAVAFRGMKRGKIIGEPSAGSTGNPIFIDILPSEDVVMRVCTKHDIAPDGTEFVGVGVIPDIEVSHTYRSYFGLDPDPMIQRAILEIRK